MDKRYLKHTSKVSKDFIDSFIEGYRKVYFDHEFMYKIYSDDHIYNLPSILVNNPNVLINIAILFDVKMMWQYYLSGEYTKGIKILGHIDQVVVVKYIIEFLTEEINFQKRLFDLIKPKEEGDLRIFTRKVLEESMRKLDSCNKDLLGGKIVDHKIIYNLERHIEFNQKLEYNGNGQSYKNAISKKFIPLRVLL